MAVAGSLFCFFVFCALVFDFDIVTQEVNCDPYVIVVSVVSIIHDRTRTAFLDLDGV